MIEKLSGFWTFLLDRFRVVALILIFILVAGSVSFVTIPRETEPTVEIPMATVTTVWPGASPADVEKLVTHKIEKEIKTLDDLEKYTSFSFSGVSVVMVEFDVDADQNIVLQKLREKIDDAEKDLPDSLSDDPDVAEVSISDVPVVTMILSGDFAWSELKRFADILEEEFETISKVKRVDVRGAPEDEVHIILDPVKLEVQKIGVADILSALQSAHLDMPLGVISVDGQSVEVTVRSEMESAAQFSEIPVKISGDSVIKVGDLGVVRREFEKFEVETYFATSAAGQPAVQIEVIKSAESGNVIKMVGNILARVEQLKLKGSIPKTLETTVTYNRADEIQESLDTLTTSGGQTLLLIAIVMLVFVGWRESFLAAICIPLSMLIAAMVLNFTGRTFNGISLFSLVLGVGLLVDNAIVVVEGMSEAIHEKKMKPRAAAVETLRVFRWPLIAGTFTTVFAFLPMLFFISGVSGQYISVIPITVIAVLVAALFVSLLVLPSVARQFFLLIPPKKNRKSRHLKRIQKWYERTMRAILSKESRVWAVLGVAILTFGFSVNLLRTNRVPVEVFPSSDFTFFNANFKFPEGTNLTETRGLVEPISEQLRTFFAPRENGEIWLESFTFTVGSEQNFSKRSNSTGTPEENVLGLTVTLTEKEDRETKSYNIMPAMQKKIEAILPLHVEPEFTEIKGGPSTSAALEIRLLGDDLNHLVELSEILKLDVEKMTGTVNPRTSAADRTLQMAWEFDRDVLAKFGLSPAQVVQTLRAGVHGVTAVHLTEGDEEIDVDVRLDWQGDASWDDPESLDILNRIPMLTPSGHFITLSQVATPKLSSELSEIQHRDGRRIVSVLADMKAGVPVSTLRESIDAAIQNLDLHPGEMANVGGDSEEGNRLMTESANAMMFALVLILIVLVTQYNSFYQSLVTLFLIPLSLTGVFLGFWAIGFPISFPTMIGIVSLAGIIVNDAIVLIDHINLHRNDGMDLTTSYIEAGKKRMQPIFLTSITTVVGMLPLSLSDEIWGGLGFAIIFGMSLSTVLTLLLIPCFLAAGSSAARFWKKAFGFVGNFFTT
ncbi:efflux RND transporter permease subunit [bacterium]|jgi:multidrug efflux pump|nr:efflux RND transporter permease subunit [bacterium]MBT6831436.1 efflux RND transporter permease subunit [bacterium]MBT6996342.1 efflux RND transporter permease subunit [bacterium]MBT7772409.1 efflux RND transporter permease subunit [bacterium]